MFHSNMTPRFGRKPREIRRLCPDATKGGRGKLKGD